MASKSKRVTYHDPAEDIADYLEPLQDDPHEPFPTQTISSRRTVRPGGYRSSIYLPMTLLLYAGVPISQFIIGLIYIERCTIRQFISTYMILSGITGIAFVIVGMLVYQQTTKQLSYTIGRPPNPKILKILVPIFILLFLLVIGWFCAAHVIVLEVKLRVELFDPVLPEYCHGNLYKPAYILIFVDYLLALVAILLYILNRISPPDTTTKKSTKRPISIVRKV